MQMQVYMYMYNLCAHAIKRPARMIDTSVTMVQTSGCMVLLKQSYPEPQYLLHL